MCDLPMHLRVLCPDRKHGPLCSDCSPKIITTCVACSGAYCNICFPGGIKLQKNKNHHDPYRPLSGTEADDIWEEWDGTDHCGRELNAIGRDEDYPPSEPEEWDFAAGAQEIEAANEAENSQLLVLQEEVGQVITTVGHVVSQLQEMRLTLGDAGALGLAAEHLLLDEDANAPDNEDNMHVNSDTDHSVESEGSDGEGVHQMVGQATGFRPANGGHPTLVPYIAAVSPFPTAQNHQFARIPVQNPPKNLDFDLKNYEPVQIVISCDFCTAALCAVCSRGGDRAEPHAEFVRCGGCGGTMCPGCCYQECSICQRGLCQSCNDRERIQLSRTALATIFPCVPNLYETGDDGTHIYCCLRCVLRRGVRLTKAAARAANPDGPPVDGYGREVNTNGLVDPRPGLQMVREQLRREFDPGNRESLIGVMDGMPWVVNDLLGGPSGQYRH